jgi:hypothetical protein
VSMPSCLRGCRPPSFSVRVPRCGLISRLIHVFFKSTKMVNSNSLPRVQLSGAKWLFGDDFSVSLQGGVCVCVSVYDGFYGVSMGG